MQHTHVSPRIRLTILATATMFVAGACGSGTTLTAPSAPTVEPTVATDAPTESTTAPVTTPTTEPAAETGVVTTPPPTTSPPTTTSPAACGDFGPIPPRPHSMPTLAFDTDGDAASDDEVTAYGTDGGWHVRVVENGIVSEAIVDEIAGWAYLAAPIATDHGDHIRLVDDSTDQSWTFATDEQSCIQQVATTPVMDADDLAAEPADPPGPVEIDDLASPDDSLACALPAIADDAIIGDEIWVDLDGDGGDNDRIVAYFDGSWKLRAEFSIGVQSEIEISGGAAHGVRVLGLADVDLTVGGDEIIAVVGGGASTVEIGVFGFHEGGCIFRYQFDGGGDFSVYSGATVTHGAGIVCGEGYITSWSFQREDDDTYSVADASFEPVSLGVFGYMPASDSYSEGLSFDDLDSDLFDCNGLSL